MQEYYGSLASEASPLGAFTRSRPLGVSLPATLLSVVGTLAGAVSAPPADWAAALAATGGSCELTDAGAGSDPETVDETES